MTTRRRPDGIPEIVPPTALQRFVFDFRSALIAVGLVAALTVVGLLYALIGIPVLLVTVCAAIAFVLWQRGVRRNRPATARAARPARRSAL